MERVRANSKSLEGKEGEEEGSRCSVRNIGHGKMQYLDTSKKINITIINNFKENDNE